MAVHTQCWNWQQIKENRDGKCVVKLGTVRYMATDPGPASTLKREIGGTRGPTTGSEQSLQEEFKEMWGDVR